METTHNNDGPHLIPYRSYVAVWLALVAFTGVTVGASYLDLKHAAILVAVLIATVKCVLVILYFMHIRYESRVFAWFLVSAFASLGIFLLLTFADYSYR